MAWRLAEDKLISDVLESQGLKDASQKMALFHLA